MFDLRQPIKPEAAGLETLLPDEAIRRLPRLNLGSVEELRNFFEATGSRPSSDRINLVKLEVTHSTACEELQGLQAAARHAVVATWSGTPDELVTEAGTQWHLTNYEELKRLRSPGRIEEEVLREIWGNVPDLAEMVDECPESWWDYERTNLYFIAVINRYLALLAPYITPNEEPPLVENGLCALTNQILECVLRNQPVRICANEDCHEVFSQSVSTTPSDTRRRKTQRTRKTGVRYCSPACSKAQGQRDRRRRAAEQAAADLATHTETRGDDSCD